MAMDEGEWASVGNQIRQRAGRPAARRPTLSLQRRDSLGFCFTRPAPKGGKAERRKGDDIEGEPQRLLGVAAIHTTNMLSFFPFSFCLISKRQKVSSHDASVGAVIISISLGGLIMVHSTLFLSPFSSQCPPFFIRSWCGCYIVIVRSVIVVVAALLLIGLVR
jgi:hypothetical protein